MPLSPLTCMTTRLSPNLKSHPVFTHLQDIWKSTAKIFKMDVFLNSEASIWQNPKLRINKAPFIWKVWLNCGIKTLGDLYEDNILKSFEDLKQEFNLPQNCFWQYLQLRYSLNSVLNQSPGIQIYKSTLLNDILKIAQSNHSVSKYYSKIIQQHGSILVILKSIWEKDLKMSCINLDWNKICQNTKKNI